MIVEVKSKLGRPFYRFGRQLSPDDWTPFAVLGGDAEQQLLEPATPRKGKSERGEPVQLERSRPVPFSRRKKVNGMMPITRAELAELREHCALKVSEGGALEMREVKGAPEPKAEKAEAKEPKVKK